MHGIENSSPSRNSVAEGFLIREEGSPGLLLASELSTPTPGKSSLKRLCKQFSIPLIEPGFFWSEPVFKN